VIRDDADSNEGKDEHTNGETNDDDNNDDNKQNNDKDRTGVIITITLAIATVTVASIASAVTAVTVTIAVRMPATVMTQATAAAAAARICTTRRSQPKVPPPPGRDSAVIRISAVSILTTGIITATRAAVAATKTLGETVQNATTTNDERNHARTVHKNLKSRIGQNFLSIFIRGKIFDEVCAFFNTRDDATRNNNHKKHNAKNQTDVT